MDCAAEEAEIRAALAGLAGIRSLHFQLAARTLSIDADAAVLPAALAAIRQAGFDPQPLPAAAPAPPRRELPRLLLALACAAAAEAVAWFGGDGPAARVAGGALAALAMAEMHSTATSLAYIALFGLGATAGMAAVSAAAALSLGRLAPGAATWRRVQLGSGALAVVIGVAWGALAIS